MQQEPPAKIGEYAFGELYSSLYNNIFLSIRKKFGFTKEEAEDITQTAFVNAYEKREQFKGISHPRFWIWIIAKRGALDYLRRRYVQGHQINYEENSNSIDALVNAGWAEHSLESMNGALPDLTALADHIKPPKRRKVFELRYIKHKTYKEICEELGMKEIAVRQNIHRAKKDLIEIYRPEK